MIKKLINLPIRQKFAVIIVPLVVVFLAFDYLQVRYYYLDYKDSQRLSKAITVGIEINHVVHEFQKERSISSGFLANQGESFVTKLKQQRIRTDSTLKKYKSDIAGNELVELHKSDLEELNAYFDKLGTLRNDINQHGVSSEESINRFSKINDVALNTVIKLVDETRDKEISQQIHAIIYFLKSKEYASIERAIGTQAFSHNHIGFDLYNKFTTLVANQNSYLDAFRIIADDESNTYYNNTIKGTEVDEVERMREVVFINDTLVEDPNEWYEVSTAKINLLKKVEDQMSNQVQVRIEEVSKKSVQNFWTFVVLDITIGTIALWLMTRLVSNLLKNVSILGTFAKRVSIGDLSKRVVIDSKDELGQYAHTFNQMVLEIRKSKFELKKQRDKAKYLYGNIYNVSLAVFENIRQGIFLLDKDFMISKLYSKAMKDIFGNEHIGRENFAKFMRPLIQPRELEALEMFMKHLFNDDMDEEVVNQLNPIEQVQIHTEQDGVVSTKYIRVDFTRIFRKKKIQNIMVTVSDETESIFLQRHIDESGKKKQQEMEQLLTILKIDASVLHEFLTSSRRMLKSISEKYEQNEDDEYSKLLSFTFDIIHNLKGNAVVIGMELIANKLHEIEEAISVLQSKDVSGKDFLAILYDVNDMYKMIDDIASMLQHVTNIQEKFSNEDNPISNIKVMGILKHGAELIAKEVGKSVNLTLENNDNVILPEAYIGPFKDIMIQLIRNSVIHGIEDPDTRMNVDKASIGELSIALAEDDNELLIRFRDDGVGLNLNLIKQKALAHGIVSEIDLEDLEESEIIDFIFREGFSIAEESSSHAGRGQGMHLIKSIIDECEGIYAIRSEPGRLFEMTIKLPLI